MHALMNLVLMVALFVVATCCKQATTPTATDAASIVEAAEPTEPPAVEPSADAPPPAPAEDATAPATDPAPAADVPVAPEALQAPAVAPQEPPPPTTA